MAEMRLWLLLYVIAIGLRVQALLRPPPRFTRRATSKEMVSTLVNLEMLLFGSAEGSVFRKTAEEMSTIERAVRELELDTSGDSSSINFDSLAGSWDCVYASANGGNHSFPETANLAMLTFNRLLPNDKYHHYLHCKQMVQFISKGDLLREEEEEANLSGTYDNGLIVTLDGDPQDQRWIIHTKGIWTAEDPFLSNRLYINFTDVCLRKLPRNRCYGASDVFAFLQNQSPDEEEEALRRDEVEFLRLVNATKLADLHQQKSSRASPLLQASKLHVHAYTDVTFLDDEGLRVMRGLKGGLYVLIKSSPDDDVDDGADPVSKEEEEEEDPWHEDRMG